MTPGVRSHNTFLSLEQLWESASSLSTDLAARPYVGSIDFLMPVLEFSGLILMEAYLKLVYKCLILKLVSESKAICQSFEEKNLFARLINNGFSH